MLWNDYYFISSSLIYSLLALILVLFLFICFIVGCMLLLVEKKLFLCIIVKWAIFNIEFIDWFFSYFYLYIVSIHLNYCRLYVIARWKEVIVFYFSDVLSSLIDSFLLWSVYFYRWNTIERMLLAVRQEVISF